MYRSCFLHTSQEVIAKRVESETVELCEDKIEWMRWILDIGQEFLIPDPPPSDSQLDKKIPYHLQDKK
jgi:hypothetical protein